MAYGMNNSDAFMLGASTLMLGAMDDLYSLNPTDNSIGGVKNVTLELQTTSVDLTLGFPATIADTAVTEASLTGSCEAYEYTAKNLMYACGLDASSETEASGSTTLSADASSADTSISLTSADSVSVGSGLVIVDPDDATNLICCTVTALSDTTATINPELPQDLASGAVVYVADALLLGAPQLDNLAMKIVGEARDGSKVAIYMPKVNITQGFNLSFSTEQHGNLPLQFKARTPASSDTYYSDFVNSDGSVNPLKMWKTGATS